MFGDMVRFPINGLTMPKQPGAILIVPHPRYTPTDGAAKAVLAMAGLLARGSKTPKTLPSRFPSGSYGSRLAAYSCGDSHGIGSLD